MNYEEKIESDYEELRKIRQLEGFINHPTVKNPNYSVKIVVSACEAVSLELDGGTKADILYLLKTLVEKKRKRLMEAE